MIEELTIDGYRGLDGVRLPSLARFNVVVGPGGSGKTNLLEAAYLLSGNGDASTLTVTLDQRGLPVGNRPPAEVLRLFQHFSSVGRTSFEVSGRWNGAFQTNTFRTIPPPQQPVAALESREGVEDVGRLLGGSLAVYEQETRFQGGESKAGRLYITQRVPSPFSIPAGNGPIFPAFLYGLSFHRSMAQFLPSFWTAIEDRGESSRVEALLRLLDDEVENVRIGATVFGEAHLRIQHRRLGPIRPEFLGEGFSRALSLACILVSHRGGVLLIDEIDASLHIGALHIVIRALIESARRLDVQIFCSTHSLEAIDAFIDLCDPLSDLRIIQLFRPGRPERVRLLDGERAKELREEIGLDLRRTG